MKKYFLSIVALAGMLFATSCQESLVEPQMEGPTTFTVQLPDQMGTKAIGSKANVNQLLVAVYQEAFDGAKAIHRQTAEVKNGVATISLDLIKGQSYDVIFWAQKDNGYVDVNTEFDLVKIPVVNKYDNHNEDNGAAFFFYKENFVPSGVAESVTLKRPFAQLNLGTTAASLDTDAGIVAIETSAITVGNVATSFNTVLGYGQGEQTLVFAAKPEPQQELEVGNDKYVYVSMDYLPISGDDEAVVTVEAQITLNNTQVVSHKFTNVPVRENYRTNIVGNLISSSSEFTVKVDDSWAGADYNEEYVAPGIRLVNGEYEITSEEGLWSLAEIVNGGTKALTASDFSGKTIKLTCDIDLENEPWTPIGYNAEYQGTFDGQGYTIKNLNVNVPMRGGLFGAAKYATITNLKIDGAVVVSHRQSAAIVGHMYGSVTNCTVNNARITLTAENVGDNKYDNGDKAGALVGLLGESGGKYQITGNTATNIVVTGFRDLGGLVGCAHPCVIKENEVENITLIKDNTHYYDNNGTPYPDNFGAILGSQRGVGTYGQFEIDYTDEENQKFTRGDIISESIEEQIKGAKEGAVVAIPAGEYTTLPNPANKITIVCQPGTVFTGTSSLNIKGSTVIGATFENEDGVAVSGTIHGTFKNCEFIGNEALRWCYSSQGNPVVFEDCVIKTNFRGFHFDDMNGDVTFKGCEIAGFNAFGGDGTITFEGCTFTNDESRYNGLNIYTNTNIKDCTFKYISGKTNFIDMEGIGKTLTIENSSATIDGNTANIADFVGGSKLDDNFFILDGKYYVKTATSFLKVCTDVLTDGTKDVKVVLGADIDLTGIEWPAIEAKAAFEIDGNGKTISNLNAKKVKNDGFDNVGMFCSTSYGKKVSFKNIIIDGATVVGSRKGESHGAVLVATPRGELFLEKVKITNSTVSDCDRSAILTTYLYFADAQVEDCIVEECAVNSIGTAGAILGYNNGHNFTMKGCNVLNTTIESEEGNNKAGILIGTWQNAGTLTSEGNTHSGSKAINAGVETNNEIGRHA